MAHTLKQATKCADADIEIKKGKTIVPSGGHLVNCKYVLGVELHIAVWITS